MILRYLLFGFLLCSLGSCSISKRLQSHQQLLKQTAESDAPAPEKLDVLASSLVQMMDEGLSFINPKKGKRFVERYGQTNRESIFKILEESIEWQKQLTTVEKIGYGASLLTKPYTRDLIQLAPKFKRKYDQIVFVAELNRKLQKGLSGIGLGKN
ncbi:MAG: hypothetical protein AAFV95_19170 [Bacteroidota bacterium]